MKKNDLTKLNAKTKQVLEQGGALLIDGAWQTAASGAVIDVVDPSSGERISSIQRAGGEEVDAAAKAAKAALQGPAWGKAAPLERERLMNKLADLMAENLQVLAELETVDVGQPIWMSSNMNVSGAIASLRYFAGWASKIHGETIPVSVPIPGSRFFGYTVKEPVGIVAAIIPWNVPVMLSIWKLAPALAAGCTIILKPSEEASMSVLYLAKLAMDAGFPPGVINVLTGYGKEVGAALIAHPDVAKITFTGSTVTGKFIAKTAAEGLKKASIELGGKSPQLLFKDANLDKAIEGIANSIFLNSGQVCVAGSRLYVHRSIHDAVVEKLARHADNLVVGPGLDPKTQIGPVVSRAQFDKVNGFINLPDGEKVTRRSISGTDGFYVAPTVITGLRQQDPAMRDEIFGPVLGVATFDEVDEAIALANDSVYGLSACVWTQDISVALTVANGIKSGKVAINTDPLPYPGMPEGGVKASGYGRDLGQDSVESYFDKKSVLIRLD